SGFWGDANMRRLLTFSVISALGVAGTAISAPVHAANAASTWEHNGSTVALEKNGDKRRIVYVRPRAALKKAGVKRGTVLFNGKTKKGGRVAGYAKIFRTGCDPVDYFVEGKLDLNKGKLVLQGQAPVYSGKNCKITGYSDDNGSSTLTFTSVNGPRNRDYADTGADDGIEQGDGGNSASDDSRAAQDDTRTAHNIRSTRKKPTARNSSSDDRANSSQEKRDHASRNNERDHNDDYNRTRSRNRQQRDYADNDAPFYRRSYDDRADDYRDDADPDGEYDDEYYEPAPRRARRFFRPYRPWWRD
ncbi:MAG: hypothetical protein P8Y36_13655, partial [Alphaproteobacteria bacterium]